MELYQSTYTAQEFEQAIRGSTSNVAEIKDVNFLDYDGTCLYSYSLEEAQALTELPLLPAHKGLICQEWNWDLEDIKALNRPVDVGATYITDDGKTRLYIQLVSEQDLSVSVSLRTASSATIEVDWGDGSGRETFTSGTNFSLSHTYNSIGSYVISIAVLSGEVTLGAGSDAPFFGSNTSVRRAEIGSGVTGLRYYGFSNASLTTITIPSNVTTSGGGAFSNSCLSAVVFPKNYSTSHWDFQFANTLLVCSLPNVAGFGSALFRSTFIQRIIIPDGTTTIGDYSLNGSKIERLVIPLSVTTIGASAFYSCSRLRKIQFLPTTPPTVENANAFTNVPTDCVIEVPADSLTAYQEATNYSGIAAQMVGV